MAIVDCGSTIHNWFLPSPDVQPCARDHHVQQGQGQHHLPTEIHQLIITESRYRPANPHIENEDRSNLDNKRQHLESAHKKCGQTEGVEDTGIATPPRNSVTIIALDVIMFCVFGKGRRYRTSSRYTRMISADQFGFRLREIERQAGWSRRMTPREM